VSLGDGKKMSKGQLLKALSSWDAARKSERRGRVIVPRLDPKERVSPSERMEILGKVEAAEQNVGFVKRSIGGVARLVGNLKGRASTCNEEFNQEVDERMTARFTHPRAFDAAGSFDFMAWQAWVRTSKLRAGDCLSVLGEGADGGGRLVCYEAAQIGDGKAEDGQPGNLVDGVFLDRSGGRAGFRILDGKGRAAGTVPRDRCIYHADEERVGRPRQVSGLAHAVANFMDMVEIIADTKHGVKVAALFGAWIEQSGGEDAGALGADLTGFLETAAETAEILMDGDGASDFPDGIESTDESGTILGVDEFIQGGRFQEFKPGQSLKTMNDTRPSPNVMALLSWLIRDMAWGLPHGGVSPEVLWDASGMNGPGMRFVMAETRRFVEDSQARLQRDCQKVWMYFLAKEIKAGRIETPPDVDCWWKASWSPQADLTIDRGRDGKLELDQLEKGLLSEELFFSRQGRDWREEREKIIREKIWAEQREKELREAAGLSVDGGEA
jgi:capsid protein